EFEHIFDDLAAEYDQGVKKVALGRPNPQPHLQARNKSPSIYDANMLLHPDHECLLVWQSEETLSLDYEKRAQLLENPRIVPPVDYKALNKLYDTFVSQKEPSYDQVYLQPPKEIGNLDPFIREHTQKRDLAVNIDWWLHARMVVLDHFMPFIDMFRKRVYDFAEILKKEVKEFEHIFDDLAAEYDQGVKKVKCLEITNRNLVRNIDCLISDNIASEVSALVITADNLPLKTQDNPSCVWEIAKCLELKDEIGPNIGDSATLTLETKITQVKDNITSLNIQLNAYKIECKTLSQRYEELAKSNMHSRAQLTGRISALTSENATLKAGNKGKPLSPSEQLEKPKVLAPEITTPPPVLQTNKKPNQRVHVSTGVKPASGASKPSLKRVPQPIKSLPAKQESRKKVEVHHRNLNKLNRVDSRLNFKPTGFVSDSIAVCKM
nr:hypothetical protein [Tanacetum cinerariifolium]